MKNLFKRQSLWSFRFSWSCDRSTGGAGALTAKIVGAEVLGDMAGGQVYELTNQILCHLNDLPTKDQRNLGLMKNF